jgi:hypothetical protein
MAVKIDGEGGAGGGTAEPLIDPLLQGFAERYVYPWEWRELGRIDSPLYLVPQLNDAAELFERGRQRWRTLDVLSKGGTPRGDAQRDFDGEEWSAQRVKAARDAHRLLLTHSSFDLSKPDDLPLVELRELVGGYVPAAALYASVAMRCAQDAADECYRLSRVVEDCARRWHSVDLAALHDADNDDWCDRIRDVLRDLAGEVAEAREFIAAYLGAARTALALASAAENAENLDAAERDYIDLWEEHEANKSAVRADSGAPDRAEAGSSYFSASLVAPRAPSPEIAAALAEKAALKKANLDRRAKDKESVEKAKQGKIERGKKTRATVCELFTKSRADHPRWSDDQVCAAVGDAMKMHKTTVRGHARALGLLGTDIPEKVSEKTGRNTNTVS